MFKTFCNLLYMKYVHLLASSKNLTCVQQHKDMFSFFLCSINPAARNVTFEVLNIINIIFKYLSFLL